MTKDEVVKSIPFRKATNNKIKELSKQYGLSGNRLVIYAVEKFISDGGKISLDDQLVKV